MFLETHGPGVEGVSSCEVQDCEKNGKVFRDQRQLDSDVTSPFSIKELLAIKRQVNFMFMILSASFPDEYTPLQQFSFQQFIDTVKDEWLRPAPILSIAVLFCDEFGDGDVKNTIPRMLEVKDALAGVENIGVVTATVVESRGQISAVVTVPTQALPQLEKMGYVEIPPSADAFEDKIAPFLSVKEPNDGSFISAFIRTFPVEKPT